MPRTRLLHRHVTAFLRCAESGSFTKAAAILCISPNALKAQIDLFEEALGFKLFERSARGLNLTVQAEAFYQGCLKLEREAQALLQTIQGESRTVKIGTSQVLSGNYLLSLWKQAQPKSDLKLTLVPFMNEPQEAQDILHHLGEKIDVVSALYDDAFLKHFNCQVLPLAQITPDLAIPDTHPLFSKDKLTLEDLRGFKILLPDKVLIDLYLKLKEFFAAFLGADQVLGGGFRDLAYYNQAYAQNLLAIGLRFWDLPHPLFALKKLDLPIKGRFGLVYSRQPSEAVREFIANMSALKEHFEY